MEKKTVRVKLKRSKPYATCDACGNNIYNGNDSVTIIRQSGQINKTVKQPDDDVTVTDRYALVILCPDCGDKFSVERVREILQVAIRQPVHVQN